MDEEMSIDGHKARVAYDTQIGMFRGEFMGLRGGADFYAATKECLAREGRLSLQAYNDICAEKGISAYRRRHPRGRVTGGQKV